MAEAPNGILGFDIKYEMLAGTLLAGALTGGAAWAAGATYWGLTTGTLTGASGAAFCMQNIYSSMVSRFNALNGKEQEGHYRFLCNCSAIVAFAIATYVTIYGGKHYCKIDKESFPCSISTLASVGFGLTTLFFSANTVRLFAQNWFKNE